jgi:hypothetical protein
MIVGREAELALLRAALARGAGRLVLIAGEPGIGKSTVVEAFAAAARATVLWGAGWDGGGAPAYWPWVQVLRAAGRSFPEAADRFALFDEVATALRDIAADAPLVVVLEDLQDAGVGTALLLEFAARHTRLDPVLLIATYREVEVRLDPPLAAAVAALEPLAEVLTPAPFGRREVAAMAAEAGVAGLTDELLDRTQGNPLFLAHVLRHLGSGGPVTDAPIPAGLRQAVRRRAARIASPSLDAAAVLGGELDPAAVAAVAGVPVDEAGRALDDAVDAGLLRPDHTFSHAVVRETLYGDLRPPARAALHLSAAQLPAATARRAHHYARAWPAGGVAEAVTWTRRAGDEAMAAYAYEEAAGHYRDALTSLGRQPDGTIRDRCTGLLALADALTRSGRLAEARRETGLAGEIADRLVDPELISRAALLAAEHLEFNAVDEPAIARLRRADAAWGDRATALRSRVLSRLATVLPDGGVAAADRAVDVAGAAGDPDALAAALSARLHAAWGTDDPVAALAMATRIRDLTTDPALRLDGRLWELVFALECGDLDRGIEAVADLDRLSHRLRRPTARHLALSRRSTVASLTGSLDEALALAREAWELARRVGLPDADAVYWGQLFAVWRQAGLPDEDVAHMESMVSYLVEHSRIRPLHEAGLLLILAATGRSDDARARLRRLVAGVPDLPHDMFYLFTLVLLADGCAALDEPVEPVRQALEPYADRWAVAAGAVACLGPVRRVLDSSGLSMSRDGDVWTVGSGGTVVRLPDSRGLAYLALLIGQPGQEIEADRLVALAGFDGARAAGFDADRPGGSPGSSVAVLDERAVAAYKQRLRDLEAEIDEAAAWHDPARRERLHEERDFLIRELASALGLHGRSRSFASPEERARVNVTRALRSAIRKIGARSPDLGARLDAAVSTGYRCRYRP